MKYLFALLFLFQLTPTVIAQTNSGENYYLVENFNPKELTKIDRRILDSCLTEFHNSKRSIDKISVLSYLCDNLMDDSWTKFQVYNYDFIKKQLELDTSEKTRKELVEYLISALSNMSIIAIEQGNKPKAIELLEEGIKLSKQASYNLGIAKCYSTLGYTYLEFGELKKALKYFEKSNEINTSLNEMDLLIQNRANIAQINASLGQPEKAMESFKICADYFKNKNDIRSYTVCQNSIALIHVQNGNYKEAFKIHSEVLEILKKIGDNTSQATTINNIGDIYALQKEYNTALKYYRQALKIARENEVKSGEAAYLNSIANVYLKQDKIDAALKNYKASLAIEQETQNDVGVARCYQNLGNLYGDQGDIKKAIEFSSKGLEIYEALNFKQETAKSYANLAQLLYLDEQKNEAKKHVEIGFEIATELGYASTIKTSSLLLYKIAKEQGDYKKALDMHVLHVKMKDSLLNLENKVLIIRNQIENEHRLETYKLKIKEREKNRKLEKQKNDIREQGYITALLILLILLIVALVLWRRSKYRLNIKWLQEDIFKSQMKPHFLFNVLVSIQSLIVQRRNKDAVEYLSEIASFMRSNLNVISIKKISIEEEITLARQYLNLEKLRFKDKLNFTINNDLESISTYSVSPLILQPLIENAIVHGFKNIDYTGEIVITITAKAKQVQIIIEDNGCGFHPTENDTSKGIKILKKRLSLANSKNRLTIGNKDTASGVRAVLLLHP